MATNWDDVGHRFTELGRRLQDAWRSGGIDEQAADDVREAGQKVTDALDGLADSINRTVASPDVKDAARDASAGVAEALAADLRQLADWLDTHRR